MLMSHLTTHLTCTSSNRSADSCRPGINRSHRSVKSVIRLMILHAKIFNLRFLAKSRNNDQKCSILMCNPKVTKTTPNISELMTFLTL